MTTAQTPAKGQKATVRSKINGMEHYATWNGTTWQYVISGCTGYILPSNAEVLELH